jgi:hypothetical protein
MVRELSSINYKKVIQLLREKPMKWSELVEATRFPDKTLGRILDNLLEWELISKDEKGTWNWFEAIRIYETEHDLTAALNHSESLLENFQGMFPLDKDTQNNLSNINFYGLRAIENRLLRNMVAEHVKTGYPRLQTLMDDFNGLQEERRYFLDEVRKVATNSKIRNVEKPDSTNDVLFNLRFIKSETRKWVIRKEFRKNVERLYNKIPQDKISQIIEIENRKNERVLDIANEIQRIVMQVKNSHDPLRGFCSGCPKTKVKNKIESKLAK